MHLIEDLSEIEVTVAEVVELSDSEYISRTRWCD